MATIEKRGESWRALIRRKGFPSESATFRTRVQADEWVRMREGELVGIRHGMAPRRTVRQAIERYRDQVSPKHRGARWEVIRLDKLLREITFAERSLEAVTGDDVGAWRDAMTARLAPGSVAREYGLLRAVFSLAAKKWHWPNPRRSAARTSRMDRSSTSPGAICPAAMRLRSHCAAKGSFSL
jgi:hypothetical protein